MKYRQNKRWAQTMTTISKLFCVDMDQNAIAWNIDQQKIITEIAGILFERELLKNCNDSMLPSDLCWMQFAMCDVGESFTNITAYAGRSCCCAQSASSVLRHVCIIQLNCDLYTPHILNYHLRVTDAQNIVCLTHFPSYLFSCSTLLNTYLIFIAVDQQADDIRQCD